MQQVQWLTFGISSAITKTALHFFPLAASTGAPYPVMVNLSVFSKDFPKKTLVIEGGRLGQPDGFRIEEAIPSLAEALPGFVGLHVELTSPQPRLDLSASCCIVEVVSTAQSVKFTPTVADASLTSRTASAQGPTSLTSLPMINDAYGSSSLLVVNSSEETIRPTLSSPVVSGSEVNMESLVSLDIPSNSVGEISVPEHFIQDQQPQECSWGLLRSRVAVFEKLSRPDVCYYVLYRENVTKRIVSAVAI